MHTASSDEFVRLSLDGIDYWVEQATGMRLPVYSGGLGGNPPPPPGMSREEKEYYAIQTEAIKNYMQQAGYSAQLQQAMLPYLFQEFGYDYTPGATTQRPGSFTYQAPATVTADPTRTGKTRLGPGITKLTTPPAPETIGAKDPRYADLLAQWEAGTLGGEYTPTLEDVIGAPTITKRPLTESQQLAQQVELEANRQTLGALTGTMPVSPALEQQLSEGDQALKERLLANLGTGYETSTPGIEALGKRDILKSALRDDVRFGRLGSTDALARAREGDRNAFTNNQFAMLQGAYNPVLQGYGSAAQMAQGLQGPANAYQNQRMMQYQHDLDKYQNKVASRNALLQMGMGAATGGFLGGAGMLGGLGAGGGAMLGAANPSAPGTMAMMNYYFPRSTGRPGGP